MHLVLKYDIIKDCILGQTDIIPKIDHLAIVLLSHSCNQFHNEDHAKQIREEVGNES